MQSAFRIFLTQVGMPLAAIVLTGAVILLLGLIGFGLALTRPPTTGGARVRQVLLLIVSAVLVVTGGSIHLIGGLYYPLARLRIQEAVSLDQTVKGLSAQYVRSLLELPRYRDPKRLGRYEFKVSSQSGEDGIIAEIFRRIGTTNRSFIEFGASSGVENNTSLLLRLGWNGLWIDADTEAITKARQKFDTLISEGRLTILESFITAENIEDLFRQGKVPEEPDLLSIDIDRNDYHVWEQITHYQPRVVIVEYEASFGPTISWVVPYDPKAFGWTEFGNGASLKALTDLGARKGYSLVGCNIGGVNAFFIRNDLLGDHFVPPYSAENHYEPKRILYLNTHQYEGSSIQDAP